jgi:hypothetical protein
MRRGRVGVSSGTPGIKIYKNSKRNIQLFPEREL